MYRYFGRYGCLLFGDIGDRYPRGRSTIGCAKIELSVLYNRMDKSILKTHIENGLSQRAIAALMGKSHASVRYWLNKYGLHTKTEGYRCKHCGETDERLFAKKGGGRKSRSCCRSCHADYTVRRLRGFKQQAIEHKGGKCIRCGYNKCAWSMSFHHRDPSEKDPNWRRMRSWKFESMKEELDKCDLLCNNCHGEVHFELTLGS